MNQTPVDRRHLFIGAAAAATAMVFHRTVAGTNSKENVTMTAPPEWLMDFWSEIDNKTFGKGFDCFTKNAICNLGVADWHGREAIRENLRAFIDTGFTARHDVVECWDGGSLKIFRGVVTMTPDDKSKPVVHPSMAHFFYMDKEDSSKVSHWYGAVGPVSFA